MAFVFETDRPFFPFINKKSDVGPGYYNLESAKTTRNVYPFNSS